MNQQQKAAAKVCEYILEIQPIPEISKDAIRDIMAHNLGEYVSPDDLKTARNTGLNFGFQPYKDTDYWFLIQTWNNIRFGWLTKIEQHYDEIRKRMQKPGFPVKVSSNRVSFQPEPTPRRA